MDGDGQCLIWPCDYTPLSKRAFSIPSHYTASLVFHVFGGGFRTIHSDGVTNSLFITGGFLEILTKKNRIYDILRVDFIRRLISNLSIVFLIS